MKKITVTLELQEPLLASAPGSDPNTEKSYPYIPGSLLRGAAAANYLQQGGRASDAEFTSLFLNGRTRFLNSYPISRHGQPMFPTPKSWLQEKDPPGEQAGRLLDMLHRPEPAPDDWPKATKRLPLFAVVAGNSVYTSNPQFEVAIHNARDPVAGRATQNEGALFRYQALARGQIFTSEVWGPDWEINKAQELLQGTLLLGGSHSAGYGLVRATAGEAEDVTANARSIKKGEKFICYLASDAILRHPRSGQTGADIATALGAYGCQVAICPGKAFSNMVWVGGFNEKWGLPLPQTWAVQKGSVWQLEALHDIEAETMAQILSQGIGDRRAEGFGQIVFAADWLQEDPQRTLAAGGTGNGKPEAPRATDPIPEMDRETASLLQRMNERLARQELDRLLPVSAMQIASSFRGRLSHSQLGRLRLRIRAAQSKPGGDLSGFAAYLAETKDRKSADDQLRKVSIKNPDPKKQPARQNFRDWMREMAGHPPHVWEQIGLSAVGRAWQRGNDGLWQRSYLGATPFVLDNDLTNHYAARLIEAVCELLSRGDEK